MKKAFIVQTNLHVQLRKQEATETEYIYLTLEDNKLVPMTKLAISKPLCFSSKKKAKKYLRILEQACSDYLERRIDILTGEFKPFKEREYQLFTGKFKTHQNNLEQLAVVFIVNCSKVEVF